jgi:hypothetical protein
LRLAPKPPKTRGIVNRTLRRPDAETSGGDGPVWVCRLDMLSRVCIPSDPSRRRVLPTFGKKRTDGSWPSSERQALDLSSSRPDERRSLPRVRIDIILLRRGFVKGTRQGPLMSSRSEKDSVSARSGTTSRGTIPLGTGASGIGTWSTSCHPWAPLPDNQVPEADKGWEREGAAGNKGDDSTARFKEGSALHQG